MHTFRTRLVVPALIGLAAILAAGLVLVTPAFAADGDVRINEFSSNNPDFIELINTGTAPVDLAGWVLKDNSETNSYTFPAGSSIAAGAIKGISGEGVEFLFGLGNGDAVRLFAPGGTVVDSYVYPGHPPAGKSYSRCPQGTGPFVTTGNATKGLPNNCVVAPVTPNVTINEVESNGDQVADWVELRNNGTTAVDVSGWKILDNDPAHTSTPVVVPNGTSIPAGGYYAIYTEIAQTPGFGLGGADSATLFLPNGSTQVDSYAWTVHAATTYGRCPDGTGAFTTTTTSTRGLANACSPVRINEVESSGGTPGDWIELKNISAAPVNLGGWSVKDSGESPYTIPSGTTIAANGYLVLDEAQFVFGLGGADAVRLLDTTGTLVESYAWTTAALQTYGRCKDGVGDFKDTRASTKGAANSCPGLETTPWPGDQTVTTADLSATFLQDLSGLTFDPADPDVLWAAQNKKGTLFKLVRDASNTWVPAAGWPKDPKYTATPTSVNGPDTEGLTIGPDGFVYLASERNNDASGVSRMSVLRFDPNATGSTILPTSEWDLTSKIPAAGANLGLEGVAFVPDSYLVGNGFKDESTNAPYNPATYPAHGSGLYFVAVEDTGDLIGFALDADGVTSHKIATIDSGFEHLADVNFDPERQRLWAVTDDTHDGKTSQLKIDASGAFVVDTAFDRPAGMPNLNNEGLAIAPQSRCVAGKKEVLWSDDGDTGGNSLRRGTINCTVPAAQNVTFTSIPQSPVVGGTYAVTATGGGSTNPVVISVDPLSLGSCSITGTVVSFLHTGECIVRATQAAAQGYLAGAAVQTVIIAKAAQQISFAQPGDTTFSAASVPLTASADSGLAVAFASVTPDVCVIDGASARPVAAGTCTVTATQAGSDDYLAAEPVSRSLTVAKAPIVVTTRSTSGLVSLLTLKITYTSTVKSVITGLPVPGVVVTTRIDGGAPTSGCKATTNASGVATCTVGPVSIALGVNYKASAAESANHLAGTGSAFIGLF
ncbi:MAG: lamin tail domain-containing protein [Propionibacteriales bacterium]|nr:lamin tail domain-containing protein [Propionibacteriales bacterium]